MLNDDELLARLKTLSKPETAATAARFGIMPRVAVYGIAVPELRILAKQIGLDHRLANRLWSSGIHEGRILATMIEDVHLVSEEQLERWVRDFDSWDICDQCCGNLFDRTPWAYQKATAWSAHEEEFVKRAAFSLIAYLAVHDKKALDSQFSQFLPIIQREANDPRNFVKKAVNWALRQIGKRNMFLNQQAIDTALILQGAGSSTARWVANDALRELRSQAVQSRLIRKNS